MTGHKVEGMTMVSRWSTSVVGDGIMVGLGFGGFGVVCVCVCVCGLPCGSGPINVMP